VCRFPLILFVEPADISVEDAFAWPRPIGSVGGLDMAVSEGMFSCPYCFSMQRKEGYLKDGKRRYRCASCGCPVEDTTVQTSSSFFHRPKVLFIDDDPLLLILLKHAMEEHGFDVFTAPDGPAGLEVARAEKPEIVVVDVLMPRMSGLEFCQRLRAEQGFKRTPIVLISARVDPALEKKGRAAGATLSIPKPADLGEFAQMIRTALVPPSESDPS
jgi:CheY-like chemotaxis protein